MKYNSHSIYMCLMSFSEIHKNLLSNGLAGSVAENTCERKEAYILCYWMSVETSQKIDDLEIILRNQMQLFLTW